LHGSDVEQALHDRCNGGDPGRKAEPDTGTGQPQGESWPPWGLLAAVSAS
jgi:hypothetical protein